MLKILKIFLLLGIHYCKRDFPFVFGLFVFLSAPTVRKEQVRRRQTEISARIFTSIFENTLNFPMKILPVRVKIYWKYFRNESENSYNGHGILQIYLVEI